jgi:hypothetical protein
MVCFAMLNAYVDETLAAGRYFLRRHACVKILLLLDHVEQRADFAWQKV